MKTLRILLAAAAIAATPAIAGGPWISIEMPVNPMDASTRGAFAVVRTYRHGEPMPYLVTGTAEGLVNGRRRSEPLRLTPTERTGSMAIARTWPAEGVWVLKLGVEGEELNAVIGVGSDGEPSFVRVPMRRQGGLRLITQAEVESLILALANGERAPQLAVR